MYIHIYILYIHIIDLCLLFKALLPPCCQLVVVGVLYIKYCTSGLVDGHGVAS